MLKNETIVDRVVERLKAQPLGDLITEEDLHDIVKEAIPRTFFEVRRIPSDTSYGKGSEKEPLIVEVMRDLLKESVKTAVQEWVASNAVLVADHWRTVLDAGILKHVQEMQNHIATEQVRTAIRAMLEPFNQDRMSRGLPQIFV